MKISDIVVLFSLSAITEGQWAVAARGLYQPIVLSVGTLFAAMNIKDKEDSFDFEEKKETQPEDEVKKKKIQPYELDKTEE